MKPVRELPRTELIGWIRKADAAVNVVADELIAAGRGTEKMDETMSKQDELSRRYRTAITAWCALNQEAQRRMTFHGKLTRTAESAS